MGHGSLRAQDGIAVTITAVPHQLLLPAVFRYGRGRRPGADDIAVITGNLSGRRLLARPARGLVADLPPDRRRRAALRRS
jgi:hypothetical protein